jgi:hypothetical protein
MTDTLNRFFRITLVFILVGVTFTYVADRNAFIRVCRYVHKAQDRDCLSEKKSQTTVALIESFHFSVPHLNEDLLENGTAFIKIGLIAAQSLLSRGPPFLY